MRCHGKEAMTKNVPTLLVLGTEILHESEKPVAFETTGMVDSNTERMDKYFAQKGLLLQFSVPELTLLFGRVRLILERTTKDTFVRYWFNWCLTLQSRAAWNLKRCCERCNVDSFRLPPGKFELTDSADENLTCVRGSGPSPSLPLRFAPLPSRLPLLQSSVSGTF